MCMAVPSRVIAVDGQMATVEAFGQTRQTSLMMMDEPVAVGDYLILGAGGNFAAEKVAEATALAAIDYLSQVLSDGLA
ncbi:HypC/HybG/HupF family hydrogenase formation chaperone [Magnetospirillum sulfuroxidans]|uniref:HypC/HybG/HupF family hydrogenase formation chaperone n=1 Tax=Magnetospirillum sulfuroxidans TaxID=611300 RepID=A0ABS5IGB6_9PROT|nr:HypC/HybG/HupF family hydrogenase formation chaperone [Magnetospirillum sulfuroxidans]MBR9973457.1 HypC/HybG/HupF family hydrogenase formation chaperone [Magnetospirillum sulfuroxidans]